MDFFDVLFAQKMEEKKHPPVIKKVTGNPIEITNAAAAPLVKCVTEIQGSQDLHGYDKPWVGGAGKNLISSDRTFIIAENVSGTWTGDTYVRNGVTFEVEYNDTGYPIKITANGTNTTTGSFVFVTARNLFTLDTSYIINGLQNGSMETGRINVQGVSNYVDGDNLITGDGETHRIGLQIAGSATVINVIWYPMLRYATVTDPTFAPYENICPITAYTEGEIVERGKNLFDKTTFNHTNTIVYKPMFVGDGTFTMSTNCPITGGGQENYKDIFFLPGNVDSGASSSVNGVIDTTPITVTAVDGYVTVASRYNSVRNDPLNYDWMIEKGSVVTEYEPYTSTTHTTTYPSAIYRGSEDVVNGEVTSEWGMIASYAGETLPGEWISDRDEYAPGTTPTTGAQVAYELATPTTTTVTPTNLPIRTLSGYNHIESITGDMEVEYITDNYQEFVDTVEIALPSTRKGGGIKPIDIFKTLDPDREKELEKEKKEDVKK